LKLDDKPVFEHTKSLL